MILAEKKIEMIFWNAEDGQGLFPCHRENLSVCLFEITHTIFPKSVDKFSKNLVN